MHTLLFLLGFIPSFATLDRVDDADRIGVQFGLSKLPQVGYAPSIGMRLELYGQLRLTDQPIGFYGQIPVSRIDVDEYSASGIGNVEAGAFYVLHSSPQMDVVLRGGLNGGTATNSIDGLLANGLTGLERVIDSYPTAYPHTVWARSSASAVWRLDKTFARADVGIDVPVLDFGDDSVTLQADDVLGHLGAGLGVEAGPVALMGELATMGILTGEGGDRSATTMAATVTTLGRHRFRAGLVVPLDTDARGDILVLTLAFQSEL